MSFYLLKNKSEEKQKEERCGTKGTCFIVKAINYNFPFPEGVFLVGISRKINNWAFVAQDIHLYTNGKWDALCHILSFFLSIHIPEIAMSIFTLQRMSIAGKGGGGGMRILFTERRGRRIRVCSFTHLKQIYRFLLFETMHQPPREVECRGTGRGRNNRFWNKQGSRFTILEEIKQTG